MRLRRLEPARQEQRGLLLRPQPPRTKPGGAAFARALAAGGSIRSALDKGPSSPFYTFDRKMARAPEPFAPSSSDKVAPAIGKCKFGDVRHLRISGRSGDVPSDRAAEAARRWPPPPRSRPSGSARPRRRWCSASSISSMARVPPADVLDRRPDDLYGAAPVAVAVRAEPPAGRAPSCASSIRGSRSKAGARRRPSSRSSMTTCRSWSIP